VIRHFVDGDILIIPNHVAVTFDISTDEFTFKTLFCDIAPLFFSFNLRQFQVEKSGYAVTKGMT
jgi:hypothetical protein